MHPCQAVSLWDFFFVRHAAYSSPVAAHDIHRVRRICNDICMHFRLSYAFFNYLKYPIFVFLNDHNSMCWLCYSTYYRFLFNLFWTVRKPACTTPRSTLMSGVWWKLFLSMVNVLTLLGIDVNITNQVELQLWLFSFRVFHGKRK